MSENITKPARQRILEAAHDLFYQEGIRATGIDKIISTSSVAKVTFYRHFPSKHDLIIEFLNYRHQLWMNWFSGALQRHGNNIEAITPALQEWFDKPEFRGCAFLNSVGELAEELPQVKTITSAHKQDMLDLVSEMLPAGSATTTLDMLVVVIEGAIIRAQYDNNPDVAINGIKNVIALIKAV